MKSLYAAWLVVPGTYSDGLATGYALLFLAFDMEMAFMYPWAVVYKEVGLVALLDMGVFLAILFLGLLYGWSQGALRRQ